MNQNQSDFSLYWLMCLAPNNFNHVHVHHGSHVSLISSSTTCGLPMHFPNLCWWFNCFFLSILFLTGVMTHEIQSVSLSCAFFIIEIKLVLLLQLYVLTETERRNKRNSRLSNSILAMSPLSQSLFRRQFFLRQCKLVLVLEDERNK